MSALTRPPAVAALASTLLLTSGGCGPTTPEPPAAVFSLKEATRFKEDWEAYLATFGPEVPKTVAEFLEIYNTKVAESSLPAEESVLNLLGRASVTSLDHPDYIDLIDTVLPRNTQLKLDLFGTYDLDALVFPYHASFVPPVRDPTFTVDDLTYVPPGDVRSPSTLAGYSSVGFPGIVVPMGFGSQGLPITISFLYRSNCCCSSVKAVSKSSNISLASSTSFDLALMESLKPALSLST